MYKCLKQSKMEKLIAASMCSPYIIDGVNILSTRIGMIGSIDL